MNDLSLSPNTMIQNSRRSAAVKTNQFEGGEQSSQSELNGWEYDRNKGIIREMPSLEELDDSIDFYQNGKQLLRK